MDREIIQNGYDNLETKIPNVTKGTIYKDIDFNMIF